MLPAFLLALREGIEAALVIGILFGALRKLNRTELKSVIWKGVISAVIVSVAGAIILYAIGLSFQGAGEIIFEGTTMLLAAGILTWMIFWMGRQARHLQHTIETNVHQAVNQRASWPLFILAFVTVVREGAELALFLTATTFTSGAQLTLIGALLGLGTAVVLGWALFSTTVHLDLRRFFQVTGILLLFFAAGLVAHGVHEFNEIGWIPVIIEHVWDINGVLDENSTLGVILKALFGYNGNPSLTEAISYVVYLGAVLISLRKQNQQLVRAPQASR